MLLSLALGELRLLRWLKIIQIHYEMLATGVAVHLRLGFILKLGNPDSQGHFFQHKEKKRSVANDL